MYKEIDIELGKLIADKFTGHVKFSIERGEISCFQITTRSEPVKKVVQENLEELKRICPDEKGFFGIMEYDFKFGVVVEFQWTISLKGEELKSRLRTNQGRKVYHAEM